MNNANSGSISSVKKKKNSGRFNFIDFILIVIVLLVIAAVIYVFAPFSRLKDMTSSQPVALQYTVEILGVDEAFIEKIKENDFVIDSVSKNGMGTVVAVDYNNKYTELQYVINENPEDGSKKTEGVLAEYPDKYNVIITISAEASYAAEKGYSVNGTRIAVGEKMSLRFPDYVGEGYCIGVERS